MSVVEHLIHARRSRSRLVRRLAVEGLALYGMDWPHTVEIGTGLTLRHRALNSMMHPHVRLGNDVIVHQGVMVGAAVPWAESADDHRPRVIVEDGVVLCAGAVVVGNPDRPTVVGRGTVIGANAVVARSTGTDEVWGGNPGRCLGRRDEVEAKALGRPAVVDVDLSGPRREERTGTCAP